MQIIGNHLNTFYVQYADDTGLSLNQVTNQVSSWDKGQFESAVSELMANLQPDNKLDKRLAAAFAQAQGTKRDMLNALVSIGVDTATAKAEQFGIPELNRQYANGYNIKRYNHMPVTELPTDINKQSEFSDRLWIHGDIAKTRMQETLNKGLQRGLDNQGIKTLTRVIKQSGDRINGNLSSDMNRGLSGVHNLMRDSGVINSNKGYEDANNDNPSDIFIYAKFNTQEDDRVCTICAPLDGEIFLWDECPVPITDTHDGCRCWRARCDADGNIDPDDDYSNPYS